MRAVEASGGAGFGSESAIGLETGIHQLWDAEPGSSAKVVRSHRMAAQQIGHLTG
jgi:hypothetical protein